MHLTSLEIFLLFHYLMVAVIHGVVHIGHRHTAGAHQLAKRVSSLTSALDGRGIENAVGNTQWRPTFLFGLNVKIRAFIHQEFHDFRRSPQRRPVQRGRAGAASLAL